MGCDGLGELPRKVMGMHVDQHLFSIARDVPFVSCSAETPITDFQHNPSPTFNYPQAAPFQIPIGYR